MPENYGNELLLKEEVDEKVKSMLEKKRKEGVKDEDVKWWWNMHDLERRIMLKIDELNRTALFVSVLQSCEAESKEEAADEAADKVRKFHPMYGDSDDTSRTQGYDRPLPYELKNRISLYIEKRTKNDPEKYKQEIEQSTTFNSLVRHEIIGGKI